MRQNVETPGRGFPATVGSSGSTQGQNVSRAADAASEVQLLITSLRPAGVPVGVMMHHVIPAAPFLTR